MNLHSYFTQQREQRLSDERKFLLYQRICEQRTTAASPLLRRASLLTKNRVYAFLTMMLVFVFFGSFFWDLPQVLEYRAFFVQKDPSGINTVSAGHIAEILEFNGDYLIEKEGKTFQNSVLFDGDLITLKDNAKIIFNINDHLKTEVQGPAKFTISKIAEGKYRLYLMEGDFLRVEGQEDTDALQVETEEMMIETTKDEKVALELSKKDQKTELKNHGATLLVKTKKSSLETAPTKLESEKLLTMQDNDIAKISDVEEFWKVLTNRKNLTHTTKLASGDSENVSSLEQIAKELEFLTEQKEFERNRQEKIFSGVQETVSTELAYHSDEKRVPTEAQLSQVTAALNKVFLLSDFQNLYIAKQENDTGAINNAYRTLSWRIKSIGDSYNVDIKVGTTPESVIFEFQKLKKGLEEYHLPPAKFQQLDVIEDRLIHMQSFVPTEPWVDYKQHLPVHLQFK